MGLRATTPPIGEPERKRQRHDEMSMHPTVAELVTQMKKACAAFDDPDEIVATVALAAKSLAENKSWLRPEYFECDEEQGMGITILNEEPDHSILVETVAWLPGRGVAPHDHQTWGVVVGIEGVEVNINWRRLDDGSNPDFAELETAEERQIRNGDVVPLLPDDIHSVRNEGETTSLSLHVYGRALSSLERYEFDPINKIRRVCPQRKRRD